MLNVALGRAVGLAVPERGKLVLFDNFRDNFERNRLKAGCAFHDGTLQQNQPNKLGSVRGDSLS